MTERSPVNWSPNVPLGRHLDYDPLRYGPVCPVLYKSELKRCSHIPYDVFARIVHAKPKEFGIRVRVRVDGEYYGGSSLWIPRGEKIDDVAKKFFGSSGVKYDIKKIGDGAIVELTSSSYASLPQQQQQPSTRNVSTETGETRSPLANGSGGTPQKPLPDTPVSCANFVGAETNKQRKQQLPPPVVAPVPNGGGVVRQRHRDGHQSDAQMPSMTTTITNVVVGTPKNGIEPPDMRRIDAAFVVGECADIGSPGYPGTLDCCRSGCLCDNCATRGAVRVGDIVAVDDDEDECDSASSICVASKKSESKKKKKKTEDSIPDLVPAHDASPSGVEPLPKLVPRGTRAEKIGAAAPVDVVPTTTCVGASINLRGAMPGLEKIRYDDDEAEAEPHTRPSPAVSSAVGCHYVGASVRDDYTFMLDMIDKARCSSWFGDAPRFILAPPNGSFDEWICDVKSNRTITVREIVSSLDIPNLRMYIMNHMGYLRRVEYLSVEKFVRGAGCPDGVRLETTRTSTDKPPCTFCVRSSDSNSSGFPCALTITGSGTAASTADRIFVAPKHPNLLVVGLTTKLC